MTPALPDKQAREDALKPTPYIVQAPAGSGKTTLLATRFIRLLSTVDRPQEILAITFTKKAAAEMRLRVLKMLQDESEWSIKARARNEALGWDVLNNPNVLKIQTIDSFAMELASQSHDRDVLGKVDIIEDGTRFYEVAANTLIEQLVDGHETAPIIADFLAIHDNDMQSAVRLIVTMLAKRDQWLDLTREISTNIDEAPARLEQIIGSTIETIRAKSIKQLLSALTASDHEYLAKFDSESVDAAIPSLMTKTGTLRRRFTRKDEVGDSVAVRELNQWLSSLHERHLNTPIERHHRLPKELSQVELHNLTLSAIVLTLAASALKDEFKSKNCIDFVELLLAAKLALRDQNGNATDLALLLDYRIKHLLVDEYQDTSRPQFEFFSMLCETWRTEEGNTVFTVGDPMQSIYRFRDADVRIFTETMERGIESIPLNGLNLSANFRSAPEIVEWCNAVFAGLFTDELPYTPATPMQSEPEQDEPGNGVQCLRFDDPTREANYIADRIAELLAKDDKSEIAILCRARSHLAEIIEVLSARSIAWHAADIDPLSKIPLVQDLHTALKTLLRPNDRLSLASLLRSPMLGLTLVELSELDLSSVKALSNGLACDPRLERLTSAYLWAAPKLHQRSIREVLQGFWLRLGGGQAYSSSHWPIITAYLDLLDPYGRGEVDLEALEAAISDLYAPSDDSANVQIMTIHKSKGLEFDHVFAPSLNHRTRPDDPELISIEQHPDGLVMGTRGHDVHDWIAYENREKAKAEEKRLLYVACTRAKRSLTLTWSQEPEASVGGLARYLEPHVQDRFSADAAQHAEGSTIPSAFLQADLFNSSLRHRISRDFIWVGEQQDAVSDTKADPIENRLEVATGTLVHKALAYLGTRQLNERALDRLPLLLDAWNESSSEAATNAYTQVNRFITTELGQWCLANHDSAVSEYALTGIVNEQIRHVVIDRMFVADGERWILDYKSTEAEHIGAPDELISRYRTQLSLYKAICGNLYEEPIRTALIMTDTASLIEIQ